jgi:hypothetical protein
VSRVTELETRVSDRDEAMKAIGRVLTDKGIKPERRIDQALGILKMYGCAPVEAPGA